MYGLRSQVWFLSELLVVSSRIMRRFTGSSGCRPDSPQTTERNESFCRGRHECLMNESDSSTESLYRFWRGMEEKCIQVKLLFPETLERTDHCFPWKTEKTLRAKKTGMKISIFTKEPRNRKTERFKHGISPCGLQAHSNEDETLNVWRSSPVLFRCFHGQRSRQTERVLWTGMG